MTAEDIRTAMAIDPEFLKLAEQLKERFGAKLAWLVTPTLVVGKRRYQA